MSEFPLMSGTGNTFIVADNRKGIVDDIVQFTIKKAEQFHLDGGLFVENSDSADFKMRIINADGSEAEMCGNGARCIAKFAYDKNIVSDKNMIFETLAGLIHGEIKQNDYVKVQLTEPFGLRENVAVDIPEYKGNVYFINTGVPHTIVFSESVDTVDVYTIGRGIRYSEYFQPAGTNVNFVEVIDKTTIKVRTYERGVENETKACGTGSTAAALISALVHNMQSPVNVLTRSGELLKVYFRFNAAAKIFTEVFLEGRVEYL